jgi:UDP-N-acetylglucosamine 2-epimerase (non-hydrolysing)
MKVDLIAGARPNFVKIAALIHANREEGNFLDFRLIHTGQHYDEKLSNSFFRQLKLPEPNINLGVGSGSQAEQTAAIMLGYEKLLKNDKPNLCIVVGDVTSSMACAITAKKMRVMLAHIEAGIRSNDWTMPEEVNRVLIDSIADLFFTTTKKASQNLLDLGFSKDRIHFVGNTMIDTLLRFKTEFFKPELWKEFELKEKNYIVVTIHRPGNVDEAAKIKAILEEIGSNANGLPVIFPVHPRTSKTLRDLNIGLSNLHLVDPLSYLEFNYLVERAKLVITDSGGITEETTVMGVPCITLRDNTERPETIELGTNELIGTDPANISIVLNKLFNGNWKKGKVPPLWDGQTGKRIIEILGGLYGSF